MVPMNPIGLKNNGLDPLMAATIHFSVEEESIIKDTCQTMTPLE